MWRFRLKGTTQSSFSPRSQRLPARRGKRSHGQGLPVHRLQDQCGCRGSLRENERREVRFPRRNCEREIVGRSPRGRNSVHVPPPLACDLRLSRGDHRRARPDVADLLPGRRCFYFVVCALTSPAASSRLRFYWKPWCLRLLLMLQLSMMHVLSRLLLLLSLATAEHMMMMMMMMWASAS